VEVDQLVNGIGGITLLKRLILVGSPLAGQQARIRLDGQLMHVTTQDGVLRRTLPCPHPARPAPPPPRRPPGRACPPADYALFVHRVFAVAKGAQNGWL
jgi:hypothetical protein